MSTTSLRDQLLAADTYAEMCTIIDNYVVDKKVGIAPDATTTESLAGWSIAGSPVYMRRVTGTTPATSTGLTLFTPSTGAASRLIEFNGWVARSGQPQRHPIAQVTPGVITGGASVVYQNSTTGEIAMWHENATYASQAFEIVVYYTK